MLHELFPRGHALYERSDFAEELEEFCCWLMENGYSRLCARGHLYRTRCSLERFTPAKPNSAYSLEQLDQAFSRDYTSVRQSMLLRASRRAYRIFLSSQNRLVLRTNRGPLEQLRDRYRYELQLRGYVHDTIQHHDSTIDEFLACKHDVHSLAHADVERYLDFKSRRVSRQYLQHVVAHLRSFLRFCRMQGETESALDVIDTPRVHADELPPRALPWPLVQVLLRSIDHSSRSGKRDYTILHLMAHYGLRPSEIVALRLDSIDWSARTFMVQQRKTRSIIVLPLLERTIRVLNRYLKHGRSQTDCPQLFLRARCPVGSLTRYAITDIFKRRATEAGLPDGYSAYSLRHAFAMRLLLRGVGLKTIGDLLGHRNLASTCQYLRLDIGMLRDVALPIPQVQG